MSCTFAAGDQHCTPRPYPQERHSHDRPLRTTLERHGDQPLRSALTGKRCPARLLWTLVAGFAAARTARPITAQRASLGRRRRRRHYAGVFFVRGCQSGKCLCPCAKGDLIHEDEAGDPHAFAFVPGTGPKTGLVKLFNLATDSSLMLTSQGWVGCFAGDYLDHYWELVPSDSDDARFKLQNHCTGLRLFSNADGRLGYYAGEEYEDQYFVCEDREGKTQKLETIHGSYGLQDSGFRLQAAVGDSTVYTDAFHAAHYVVHDEQLMELREEVQGLLCWGAAADLGLSQRSQPHAWAIAQLPVLQRLAASGIISAAHPRNVVHRRRSTGRYAGVGLRPSQAISFALAPVSCGHCVQLQRSWVRAWHAPSVHALESIARQGLRSDKKGRIFLSPSFQYPFCLYAVPDLLLGDARFRLVLEVRVRPGSYWEHGDHYRFCALQQVERNVPEECMEWELVNSEDAVQVVGLTLKQLQPEHPTLRHDTNVRHAGRSLLHL